MKPSWKRPITLFTDYWTAPLHVRLRRIRWVVPIIVIFLASVHQMGLNYIIDQLSEAWHQEAELLIYGFTGSIVSWIGLTGIARSVEAQANAEKKTKTAYEKLETNHQQLITLNEIGQLLSVANSEQAVLDLAVRAPKQLAGSLAASIVTYTQEKNSLKLDMAWGLSDHYVTELKNHLAKDLSSARCKKCSTLQAEEPGDCPLFANLHHVSRIEGISGLICIPMINEQERIGMISAYYREGEKPSEDQVHLLNVLSGVIATMLENLRSRTKQTEAIFALDQILGTAETIAPAMMNFEDQVLRITSAGWDAQAAGLFLFDQDTQSWSCKANHGLGDDLSDKQLNYALGLVHEANKAGTAILRQDITPENGVDFLSAVSAPLIAEGQTLGAIFLASNRKRTFQNRHTELLNTMSHQIALAIRNAQLYVQLDQLAVLKERFRLSREIHDGLAQTLAYINLQTERLEGLIKADKKEAAVSEAGEMRKSIQSAYLEAREAIEGLRQELDRPDQMIVRLSEYSNLFSQKTGIETNLCVEPTGLLIAPTVALQLLRIVQESLTNVRKHSKATKVDINVTAVEGRLELAITDNGIGFPDVPKIDQLVNQKHFGLTTMRERARNLGGDLTIATGEAQGTRISVTVPLQDNKKIMV